MLQTKAVKDDTLGLLKRLMQDGRLNDFSLVGGTALALQIGHRQSIDIDLFSRADFDAPSLKEYLQNAYVFQETASGKNTLKGIIDGVAVDLITHNYAPVKELVLQEEIRMAGLEDISAMKLNAIAGNGTRLKDFVDVAFLSSRFPLKKMREWHGQKYALSNPLQAIIALNYFDDINFGINYARGDFAWGSVKERIEAMIKCPTSVFPPLLPRKK